MKKKVLLIFGTRPESIKMAPLVKEFKSSSIFETKICVTAQHREMLDQVLSFFSIEPEYDLDLMTPGQNLYDLTSNIISGLKVILEEFTPDYVFVHGDTTTTMAASIAGFYSGAEVCHIEAGLRTNNKNEPFPEEINRQITSRICEYHFAPTEIAKNNLLKENIPEEKILITGNTVIDALIESVQRVRNLSNKKIDFLKSNIKLYKETILVTAHRRENHGKRFKEICLAIKEIAEQYPSIIIVFPVHLNPKIKEPAESYLSGIENILLISPLDYPEFVWLMNESKLIITDSGGVQEEAPSLGKPVLVMRETTERPEAVQAGTVILVGANRKRIINEVSSLINNQNKYEKMSELHNPYGDGLASQRIVNFLKNKL